MPRIATEKHGLAGYLTISEAAIFLGVSASTLRNWDREGKLTAKRHPINGYRLYEKGELESLLSSLRDNQDDK